MLEVRNRDVCNVMFHGCNLQMVYFSFFDENMPKVTLGKKNRLSLHWRSEEDIGDLYVKNVTNSELINQANELKAMSKSLPILYNHSLWISPSSTMQTYPHFL